MSTASRSNPFGVGLFKQTVSEFSDDECTTMAAALAYYTALSMPPLLVIVVTVAGWIWGPQQVVGQIEQQVSNVVGDGGWKQLETMMEKAGEQKSHGLIATALGIGLLLFTATGVMVQLQAALNKAWQVEPDPDSGGVMNFITKRLMSLAMILGLAFILIVSLVLTAVLKAASSQMLAFLPDDVTAWVPQAINAAVNLVVFTLLFAAMFKWLPDADIRWKDTLLGAGGTALLFLLGQFGMGIYFGMKQTGTYGMAASFVLLLIWVYYSSLIFLLGAEFTQVLARRRGHRIQPEEGAVRVVREKEHIKPDDEKPDDQTAGRVPAGKQSDQPG